MSEEDSKQIQLLKEILKWIKFSGIKDAKTTLSSVLDTNQKRLVYQLSDGTHGIVEIAKRTGIRSNSTIDRMWQIWSNLGLGENIAVKGGLRFKRSFNLEDFGIEVPLPTEIKGEKKEPKIDIEIKDEKLSQQEIKPEKDKTA